MLFTEPTFLFLFLPLVLGAYYAVPRPVKNLILLIASLLFYAAGEGFYTGVMIFSILFNYACGMAIEKGSTRALQTLFLIVGVIVNLGLLVSYKYADFLVGNLNVALAAVHLRTLSLPHMHLPVGISFFTFHALSYITDVWRREVKAMRSLTGFALYITLFPQLIAGPIIRYKTIQDQFMGRGHSSVRFAEGVERFVIGLGKKMLIANTVAAAADAIFKLSPAQLSVPMAWLGVTCYAIQIYFDFSGYSDMAVGLGRMFGFVFPENFNYPYIATSVGDFWRRWHMSLSNWFRDYLYIPMGGNRVPAWRVYFNLLTVFFLCGLWHGASWTFIAWGLYQGLFLIIERFGVGKLLEKLPRIARHAYLIVVTLCGWVFFRADTIGYAVSFLKRLAFIGGSGAPAPAPAVVIDRTVVVALIAGVIGSAPLVPWIRRQWHHRVVTADSSREPRIWVIGQLAAGAALMVIYLASVSLSAANTYNPFIYFRF
jgi:alginate O-acetyltransferase complex protein AlgI